ncbi:hypothetical protein [Peptoniphilus stercorisuis]|uniref:Uncharacterized protein HemY n=1 Tax=Peptoniphilus stercorisuis TaxID=1436965 RepID=A0ABS4KE03_9FIRM|nr:hypothetical protein [Peptoniphilus stercorisuis]MBP2025991.1 uncharacterized protein HemY [Peptoniphilus stercorisuis]
MNGDKNNLIITIIALFIGFNLLKVVANIIKPLIIIVLLLFVLSTIMNKPIKDIVRDFFNKIIG